LHQNKNNLEETPMENNPALQAVVRFLENSEDIEGAFVFGSLVNQHRDAFSDVEVSIVAKNTAAAFNSLYGQHEGLLKAIGTSVETAHGSRDHIKTVSALFGRSQFPPIGLEVKLIYGQLRYVQEMLPYTDYEILLDKNGKLATALEKLRGTRPPEATERALKEQMQWYPFRVQDALKAYEREEDFDLQATLEDLRGRIFFAAAARWGGQIEGAKRAERYLSAEEHQVIAESYQAPTLDTLRRMNDLYVRYLDDLKTTFGIGDGGTALRETLKAIL
jgi:predicted nucleotidyltransferase